MKTFSLFFILAVFFTSSLAITKTPARNKIISADEVFKLVNERSLVLDQKHTSPSICNSVSVKPSDLEEYDDLLLSRSEINHILRVLFYVNFLLGNDDGDFTKKGFFKIDSKIQSILGEIDLLFTSFWDQTKDEKFNLRNFSKTFKAPISSDQSKKLISTYDLDYFFEVTQRELSVRYVNAFISFKRSYGSSCRINFSQFFSIYFYSNFGYTLLSKAALIHPAFRQNFLLIEKNLISLLNQLPTFKDEALVGTFFHPSYLSSLNVGDPLEFAGFLSGSYNGTALNFARNVVLKVVKNRSGKLVSYFSEVPDEREILWYKPKFKVLKIQQDDTNKTWITVEEI